MQRSFTITRRRGPIIAAAIHAGHIVRPDVSRVLALAEESRLREEDPATERIADCGVTLVTVHASRFQVDLNRERARAIYATPADAWGLNVWKYDPPSIMVATSRADYDAFYEAMRALITDTIAREGRAVVFDVHSYNHRRGGPEEPPEASADNPEVNLGTGSVPEMWLPVCEALATSMRSDGFDVRENVKFDGGAFPRWVNTTFPRRACALAIEFKKTYVDEWTGLVDDEAVTRLSRGLARAADRVTAALGEVRL